MTDHIGRSNCVGWAVPAGELVAAGLRIVAIRQSTDDPQWSSVVLACG